MKSGHIYRIIILPLCKRVETEDKSAVTESQAVVDPSACHSTVNSTSSKSGPRSSSPVPVLSVRTQEPDNHQYDLCKTAVR